MLGVYVNVPSSLNVIVPFCGSVTFSALIVTFLSGLLTFILLSLSNTDSSATISVSPWLTVYESLTASGVITADGSSTKSWLYVRSPTVALNVQPALVYEDPA